MPIVPLAPITPTHLICLGCGKEMRRVIEKYNNGKVSGIVFYCDSCKYGHRPSMLHAQGEQAAYKVSPETHPAPTSNETPEKPKAASGG